jgi:hypothetical protein
LDSAGVASSPIFLLLLHPAEAKGFVCFSHASRDPREAMPPRLTLTLTRWARS